MDIKVLRYGSLLVAPPRPYFVPLRKEVETVAIQPMRQCAQADIASCKKCKSALFPNRCGRHSAWRRKVVFAEALGLAAVSREGCFHKSFFRSCQFDR
jgi:hypothetical protein